MKFVKNFLPLRNASFRQQLVFAVAAGVLCMALLSSLASSWYGASQIRDTLIRQGERAAENLARQSKLALLYHSSENVADAVNLTLAFPDITAVEIFHSDGKPLISRKSASASHEPTQPIGQPARADAFLEAETNESWRFVAPVFTDGDDSPFALEARKGELLGHVRVVYSKATMGQLRGTVFAVNLTISFFFAFIFLIAIRLLTDRLTRPVTLLSESMAKAEQGESGVRAELSGPKDIMHMAHAFNSMMSVLEEREQELRSSRDEAMKFARLKAEFAATVSHEIRTPLNGVVGTLDMLMASNLPTRQRQYVEIAWDSAQYLLDLINNILDFSKLEAGKLQLEKSEFNVRRLIEEVIELLAQQAHQKGLELGYVIAPDAPLHANGDMRAVRQILMNLTANAVKFTYSGEIAICVAVHNGGENASKLRFDVIDSGIGVSDEAKLRIFDSFTQADTSTTRRHAGSGLGLAICKQLVGLMGGEIGVDSNLGGGSRFWFTLPLEISLASTGANTEPRNGHSVLVVDESPIGRHFIEQSLGEYGFVCRSSATAEEAIAILHEAVADGASYHMIILDTVFATTSGGDLLTRIRGDARLNHTRIILMNRYGAECPPMAIHQTGADAYLSKPLRLEHLLACINRATANDVNVSDAITTEVSRPVGRMAPCIMIVEDNRTNQAIAQGMVSMLGCSAEVMENGHDALGAFKRQGWDLILMDCNMPDMDGYQVTATIRLLEEKQGKRTPIVAMTANAQPSDIDKCLSAGMDDHLSKPLTLGSIAAKLRRWIPGQSIHAPDDSWAQPESEWLYDKDAAAPLDSVTMSKLREALGDAVGQAILPFVEDMPEYLQKMEQAISYGDLQQLRRVVHAVKGAAGNLGATSLASVAKEIEEKAATAETAGIEELLVRLRAEYALVKPPLLAELKADSARPMETQSEETLVLIVDDDRSTRSALRYSLQRNGFQVDEAEDGAKALALLERISPDIILMDAVMPVMDGFAACAQLQEMPTSKNIPVLMITALEDNQSIERAFAAGASDYIAKPINLAVVNQRVRRVVEATRAERHVRHLAYNDTLTGLPNRVLFSEYLNRSIERADSRRQSLAVLFLDLDRFKFVNDTLGHDIGDSLLKSVAWRIKHCVRVGDCVARLGGDEFTIILDDLSDKGAATFAAQKICRALAAPFEVEGHDIFVSASIGISLYPADGDDVSTLLRHADTAMYRAKNLNSGCEFYEAGMEVSVSEHLRLESALRRGLERNEFVVYYQPIADTDTLRITGAEALIRWRHPGRGMVSPAQFIPLAEETGLINQIGEWVLRTACRQAKVWLDGGISDFHIAVNISGNQLQQSNFIAIVEAILAETKLPPKHLALEITESVIMGHAQETVAVLESLKRLGLNLVIDDFGTGYSSLSYLKRFPVDVLKIDGTFTNDMTSSSDGASIVTGIIALAHSLRLQVVAEGVETKEQRDMLTEKHCDFIQGYYLSEPAPADVFENRVLATNFPESAYALRPSTS
ncbi:MAG TPA: EAL domain-containing protein [Burkholderiales bacterium]|nr:EAL domain-containing protein [Burkholderiales bacterium]